MEREKKEKFIYISTECVKLTLSYSLQTFKHYIPLDIEHIKFMMRVDKSNVVSSQKKLIYLSAVWFNVKQIVSLSNWSSVYLYYCTEIHWNIIRWFSRHFKSHFRSRTNWSFIFCRSQQIALKTFPKCSWLNLVHSGQCWCWKSMLNVWHLCKYLRRRSAYFKLGWKSPAINLQNYVSALLNVHRWLALSPP